MNLKVRMANIDFAIIGAPKSATTFMHQTLLLHPDIHMEAGENIAFFRDTWREELTPFLERASDLGKRLSGLKRPDLMFSETAMEHMATHNPFMKCIAVLRHPVERSVAHYYHLASYSFIPLLGFEEGIDRVLSGDLVAQWPRSVEVLNFSHYRYGLELCSAYFGRCNTLLLTHDDVTANARLAINRVCDFLGLDHGEDLKLPTERHQKVMYSLERLRFLRHMNEGRMVLNEIGCAETFRGQSMTEVDHAWVQMVRQFDLTNMNNVANVPPRLNEKTWQRLYARFRDDIEYVERLLGTPLPGWHQNPLT